MLTINRCSAAPRGLAALLGLLLAGSGLSAPAAAGETVNIYSYREPGLIAPLLKAFTDKTGITTNVVFAQAGLNERLAAEAQNSPADVLLTVDIARLTEAKEAGLTQAAAAKTVTDNIPASLRDGEGHWLALTMRARVVYASKDRVKQGSISYEELADPKWKGKICSRSGQHAYNTALIASIIAHKGEAAAETWLRGVKENLAQKPAGGDREQVRDVYAGKCDIAIGNTYYMALMQANTKNPEQQEWAKAVKIILPNAADRGSHVNVSGIALAKHAPNKDNAIRLMEFLASAEAQRIYATTNNEYPVNPAVAPSDVVKSWGTLKPDALPLETISKYRKKASELVDRVGFDAGPSS
jgi:iron(III) transport system substrate-binding protein